ncbi:MAG: hypothetical protein IPM97_15475 [Bdellovibrionaceae bacterium]|nr:hypothetical protein [Pseudobdellovibrionaceae bacterium]
MNFAHLHLIINHIPLIGIPVALLFLAHGLWTKNASTQKFSLLVLFGLAAMVLPVYLTGEPAEEVVEHLPGVAESFIESHEDVAKFSLILTLATGALAFIALWFQKNESRRRTLNFGVMGIATLALLSLAYTANLGGKIRHTELRSGDAAQADGAPAAEGKGGDDD